MEAGPGFCREGFCRVKWVSFCAPALCDFGVLTLLKHHGEEKVYKGMLSGLRWGVSPHGDPHNLFKGPREHSLKWTLHLFPLKMIHLLKSFFNQNGGRGQRAGLRGRNWGHSWKAVLGTPARSLVAGSFAHPVNCRDVLGSAPLEGCLGCGKVSV